MAVSSIGGISAVTPAAPASATAPADAVRRGEPQSKDSTPGDSIIVISKITKTNPDGSTVTTITYADGRTKVETTPPKYAAAQANAIEEGGRVTAVDILA